MKRIILIALGAVLFGTGASAQGVSLDGSAGMGFIHAKDTLKWNSDFDVAFSATGTTDGGLTFGGSAKLQGGSGVGAVSQSTVYISGEAWKVSIGDVGRASDMAEVLSDVGYDGLGVDDIAEGGADDNKDGTPNIGIAVGQTGAKAKASFTLGNATLAISTADKPEKGKTPWAAGLSVNAGNMSFNAGVDSQKLISAGVTASLGGITTALYYAKDQKPTTAQCGDGWIAYDKTLVTSKLQNRKEPTNKKGEDYDDNMVKYLSSACVQAIVGEDPVSESNPASDGDLSSATTGIHKQSGLGASVSFAASDNTKVTLSWAKGKHTFVPDYKKARYVEEDGPQVKQTSYSGINVDNDAIGIGIESDLGGGASLQAGIAKIGDDTKVSAGISMSF